MYFDTALNLDLLNLVSICGGAAVLNFSPFVLVIDLNIVGMPTGTTGTATVRLLYLKQYAARSRACLIDRM